MRNQSFTSEAFALCIFGSLFLATFVTAICYYPDQSEAGGDVPCSDSEEHSYCCGHGYACLSNKVCRQPHEDANGTALPFTYGRGSCTDRTWRSSACPTFCLVGWSRKRHFEVREAIYGSTDRSLAALGMDNCDQATESSYCCGTLNGTRTQDYEDGVPGICDCNASRGDGQPLRFGGNATAVTTIGVPDSSTSQISSTFSNSVISSISFTPSSPSLSSSSSVFSSASSSTTLKASQSLTISDPLQASSSKSPVTSSSTPIPRHSPKNPAVIIGVTVGLTVILILVAGFASVFYCSNRKSKTRETQQLSELNPNDLAIATRLDRDLDRSHELLASTGEQELLANTGEQELLASTGAQEMLASLNYYHELHTCSPCN